MTKWIVSFMSGDERALRIFCQIVLAGSMSAFALAMFSFYMMKQGY